MVKFTISPKYYKISGTSMNFYRKQSRTLRHYAKVPPVTRRDRVTCGRPVTVLQSCHIAMIRRNKPSQCYNNELFQIFIAFRLVTRNISPQVFFSKFPCAKKKLKGTHNKSATKQTRETIPSFQTSHSHSQDG
jgi:hypothetical protein